MASRLGTPEEISNSSSQCQGTRIAYGRHRERSQQSHPQGVYAWGSCFRCNLSLGCSGCATSNVLEVMCESCAAWGTKEAFLHHGPIDNKKRNRCTPLARYPESWRREYEPPCVPTIPFNVEQVGQKLTAEKALPRDKRIESEDEWR